MNIIKKIIKYFSPPTMEIEVNGKRYKLVFIECFGFHTMWTVRVVDLSINKIIGDINIADMCITDRTVESVATKEIEKLIQKNELEKAIENKRKESMKYYFGD